jgi:hypothetical protein
LNITQLSINFHDSVEEEIRQLQAELRIGQIIEELGQDQPISSNTRQELQALLYFISDIFSPDLPAIHIDPQITLLVANRDMKLALLLRERGLFRLFRLLIQENEQGVPIIKTIISPYTGDVFRSQEEFLEWFRKEAGVPRSLVFERIGTIKKLLNLGLSLEQAYQINIARPHTVTKVLNQIALWADHEMVDVNNDVARRVVQTTQPDSAEKFLELLSKSEEDLDALDDVIIAYRPAVIKLLEEVAAHRSSGDAMDFVQHDVLKKPEIRYRIDPTTKSLLVDIVLKQIDPEGIEYIAKVETIEYAPQSP